MVASSNSRSFFNRSASISLAVSMTRATRSVTVVGRPSAVEPCSLHATSSAKIRRCWAKRQLRLLGFEGVGVVGIEVRHARTRLASRPVVTAGRQRRLARPSRPRGRRSVDLAGPSLFDLQAGDPERAGGRGRCPRTAAAEPARRTRADHADRPEGVEPRAAGRGTCLDAVVI
jgi:hypothetical protein